MVGDAEHKVERMKKAVMVVMRLIWEEKDVREEAIISGLQSLIFLYCNLSCLLSVLYNSADVDKWKVSLSSPSRKF